VKRLLAEYEAQARHSLRMATIHCDLDVPFDLDAAVLDDYDRDRARALFARIEMPSLAARLPELSPETSAASAATAPALALGTSAGTSSTSGTVAPAGTSSPGGDGAQEALRFDGSAGTADIDVRLLLTRDDVVGALPRLGARISIRSVIEEPVRLGRILGIALAAVDDPGVAHYLPVGHIEGNAAPDAVSAVAALLADPSVAKTAYDLKRELVAWGVRGTVVGALDFDVMLAAYLVNTRQRVPSLTLLASDLLGVHREPEDAILGTGRGRRAVADLTVQEAAEHWGGLVALIGPVRLRLEGELETTGSRGLLDTMEMPLVPIIAGMEKRGMRVDVERLAGLSAELFARITELETAMRDAAGYEFNPGSTQQLAKLLYDDLGLAAGRRTKTGRSTDADTLAALSDEHIVVPKILEWRQLTKLKGTYVDALPLICDREMRVHTSFNQAVAATGRLSSSDPNLQNIPIRSEWGRRIRDCFVADEGSVLVSADYSQIELRVLAHVTGDEALVAAFRRGEDIHARTAAEVYKVPLDQVTTDMRRNAKVVNFGVVYGLSDFGLARDTGMSQEEARVFIERYFAELPKVAGYLETIRNHARQWGYVDTLFGRRRYLSDIRAANRQIRLAAERMAVNMPMQGAAADIMKRAMIDTNAALQSAGLVATLLLQVHDELVLEAPARDVPRLIDLVRAAMSGAADLIVPLDVDVKTGTTWAAMTKVAAPARTTA